MDSSVVGRSVSFGGIPGVTINGEAEDGEWVKRLVDGEWYYIPMEVYENAFGRWDQPDDWDHFFRKHGFQRINADDNLIPVMTRYDEDGNPINYVDGIDLPPVWYNQFQQAEQGTYHRGVALYFDVDLNEFVYVDEASGMRLVQHTADPNATFLENDSPYEQRQREALKGTGVPEVDHWNRLVAEGKFGELFFGQGGLGEHGASVLAGVGGFIGPRKLLHGSGPLRGFLEVSGRVKSTKAVQNFRGKKPTDFRFDPEKGRFVMGKGGILGHDAIPGVSNNSPGGRIRFQNGKLITDEWSGHYGNLWTPKIRAKFIDFMKQHNVNITHQPWKPGRQ